MNLIKRNIFANYIGSIWMALMSFAFVPIYIRFLGIESYGLIGFFAALQGMFALMDMGISTTLNREMASLSVQSNKTSFMRDSVRTLEIVYWAMAFILCLIVVSLSGIIANHWINPKTITIETVENAIKLMGVIIAFRWPLNFYFGGLKGLQCQVLQNSINSVAATLRGVGAIFILWLVSPTIEAFFMWQVLISALQTVITRWFLWRILPKDIGRARFRLEVLNGSWRFAAGITGIMVIDTILTQLDKIILSKMLTLEMFGYYSLATVVAIQLRSLFTPIFDAVYPKFTNLSTLGTQTALVKLYHKSCQAMSVIILPTALVIAFFSYEILLLWTHNPTTANQTYLFVSIMIIGTAINGLMNIPYALQLANGWPGLTLKINIISLIIFVPYIILITKYFGALGAATTWPLLNAFQMILNIHNMHRRLLPSEKSKWVLTDVGLPLFTSLIIVGFGKLLIGDHQTARPFLLLSLFSVSTISLFVTAIITPEVRHQFFITLKEIPFFRNRIKIFQNN